MPINNKRTILILGTLLFLVIIFFGFTNKRSGNDLSSNSLEVINNKKITEDYTQILNTTFANKTVSPWNIQANEKGITVVPFTFAPTKNVMKAHINVKENFSSLPSGTPRAEILGAGIKLENDSEYIITFNTYLPPDFQIEKTYSNPHSFFQVHQNLLVGSPQLALGIDQDKYRMTSNSSASVHPEYKPTLKMLGNINGDLGKWVKWVIYYKPSYSSSGRVIIFKDKKPLLDFKGVTAYDNVTGYLKFGLYKWNWQKAPTTTNDIVTYFSDIHIYKKNWRD